MYLLDILLLFFDSLLDILFLLVKCNTNFGSLIIEYNNKIFLKSCVGFFADIWRDRHRIIFYIRGDFQKQGRQDRTRNQEPTRNPEAQASAQTGSRY